MKIPQNYPETLDFLYAQLPMYQRKGKVAYKKDLTNTLALLEALDHPEKRFPSVHIGGTNGKGSVSSILNSVLMESGYKTGLYTSPHLVSFTERIRISGSEIAERAVVSFVQKLHDAILDIKPSFFELSFAMAMDYFAQEKIDIAVVEVGLGGRLDSTNVLQPILCGITNISMDHQELLGDTRVAIAGEKAGIIKANTPIVIGEKDEETYAVFLEKATSVGAPLMYAQDAPTFRRIKGDVFSQTFRRGEKHYELGLAGAYQQMNLQTSYKLLEELHQLGWHINHEAMLRGLKQVKQNSGLRGRMEVVQEKPLLLADTAHNEAGVASVMQQLSDLGGAKHIVWGMVADKEIEPILALLPRSARYYFVKADVPRGKDATTLAQQAAAFGLVGEVYDSVKAGLEACLSAARAEEICFVGGSTFVVAEVLE